MGRKLPLRWASDAGSKLTIVGFSGFPPPAHFHVMLSLRPQLRADVGNQVIAGPRFFVIRLFYHSPVCGGVGNSKAICVPVVVQGSVLSDFNISDGAPFLPTGPSLRARQSLFTGKDAAHCVFLWVKVSPLAFAVDLRDRPSVRHARLQRAPASIGATGTPRLQAHLSSTA